MQLTICPSVNFFNFVWNLNFFKFSMYNNNYVCDFPCTQLPIKSKSFVLIYFHFECLFNSSSWGKKKNSDSRVLDYFLVTWIRDLTNVAPKILCCFQRKSDRNIWWFRPIFFNSGLKLWTFLEMILSRFLELRTGTLDLRKVLLLEPKSFSDNG